jgi:hypothetical protein
MPYRCRYLLANRNKADYVYFTLRTNYRKPEEKKLTLKSYVAYQGINKIAQKKVGTIEAD